jgi:hypothetical protein
MPRQKQPQNEDQKPAQPKKEQKKAPVKRAPTKWMEHLKKFREQNPDKSLKDAMKLAKTTYTK